MTETLTPKILIIEDDPSVLRLMETILQPGKLQTVPAINAAQAVRYLRKTEHDLKLIVTDYNLPDATGGDVAQIARSQVHTKDIPILLVSAEEASCNFTKMLSAGLIDAYLAKPFALPAFVKTVNLLLKLIKVQIT